MGISGSSFWIGRGSRKLECRTMTGLEKLILFRRINIPKTFPELERGEEIQSLWQDPLALNLVLSTKPGEITDAIIKEFDTKSKAFVTKFISIYPTKHVTPYMPCMMVHVSEFMAALYHSPRKGLRNTMT